MTHPYQDLKEAAERATPGEWSVGSQNDALYITVGKPPAPDNDSPVHDADRRALGKIYTADDAAFIALSRNRLPELLADYERMREALEKIDNMAGEYAFVEPFHIARAALKDKP